MEWQPISTAPKDGTHVLVSVTFLVDDEPHSETWVDFWHDGSWMMFPNLIMVPFPPTYWMPLPEPPQ